jgi:hypothetical protein
MAFLVKDMYLWSVAGCVATRNRHTGEFGDCSYNPPCSRGFESEDNKGKGKEAIGDGEEDCEDRGVGLGG